VNATADLTTYERLNHWYWEDLARLHLGVCKDTARFVASGGSTLRTLELDAAGSVHGKRVLHLMCHLGFDSISWARLGASVTAIDASPTAIDAGRSLAARCGVTVDFRCLRIPTAIPGLKDSQDLVVMTYGVVEWIPDLVAWAKMCYGSLSPGGRLILIDDHPHASAPYGAPLPRAYKTLGSYLDRSARIPTALHYRWCRPVRKIRGALQAAGFDAIKVTEYPYCHYDRFPGLLPGKDGYFHPVNWDGSPRALMVRVTGTKS
jgi:2-polyprenyl-3-methyl-5-hydroxy-6-metoxy-1,4-benzoquinol methylase